MECRGAENKDEIPFQGIDKKYNVECNDIDGG